MNTFGSVGRTQSDFMGGAGGDDGRRSHQHMGGPSPFNKAMSQSVDMFVQKDMSGEQQQPGAAAHGMPQGF